MLSNMDRRILCHLQRILAASVAALAEAINATPAVCARCLGRLRERDVLLGQEAVIDWRVLGYEVEVSLRVA